MLEIMGITEDPSIIVVYYFLLITRPPSPSSPLIKCWILLTYSLWSGPGPAGAGAGCKLSKVPYVVNRSSLGVVYGILSDGR